MANSMRIRLALTLSQEKLTTSLDKVAEIVWDYYPEVALRWLKETEEYPEGFWKMLLEKRPEWIYKELEALRDAIKKSVIDGSLKPRDGLKILPIEERTIHLAESLLALSGEHIDEVLDKAVAIKASRVRPWLHSIVWVRPHLAPELAKLCCRGEFISEAMALATEGFIKEAVETLINTSRGRDDPNNLKAAIELAERAKEKELIIKAFEEIVTSKETVKEFLDILGWTIEDLFSLWAKIRPPQGQRVKELVKEHRNEAWKIIENEHACPRPWLDLADRCDEESIENALTIPFKSVSCPAIDAVRCALKSGSDRIIAKLVDYYGCIALREAIKLAGIKRSFLELIKTSCPSVAQIAVEMMSLEDIKEYLEWIKEIYKVLPLLHTSNLATKIAEAYAGTGNPAAIELVKTMSKKAGLDESLPRLMAKIYGRIDENNRKEFENFKTQLLLKLICEYDVAPGIALTILKRASDESMYIPVSTLIRAYKLGVPESELLKIAERLPIHTSMAFDGRLAIRKKNLDARMEYVNRSLAYGAEIPKIILEELAKAYAEDPSYLPFLRTVNKTGEIKTLVEVLGNYLRGQANVELLDLFSEVLRKRRPAPEVFRAMGQIFEGSKNHKAIEKLRSRSMDAMPIEALEALKSMRLIHPEVVDAPWFYERFTPTLARASLSPGGYGAFGILTAIYKGVS